MKSDGEGGCFPKEALPAIVDTAGKLGQTKAGYGWALAESWVSRRWKVKKANDETGC